MDPIKLSRVYRGPDLPPPSERPRGVYVYRITVPGGVYVGKGTHARAWKHFKNAAHFFWSRELPKDEQNPGKCDALEAAVGCCPEGIVVEIIREELDDAAAFELEDTTLHKVPPELRLNMGPAGVGFDSAKAKKAGAIGHANGSSKKGGEAWAARLRAMSPEERSEYNRKREASRQANWAALTPEEQAQKRQSYKRRPANPWTPEQHRAYMKAYNEANKEQKRAYRKAYYEANKEKAAAHNKAYYEANKEKITAYKKAYYEANKEKAAAYYEANKEKAAAYREANREQHRAYMKAYNEANKEKIAAYKKAYRAAQKAAA
jgi:hypothetical protein